MTKVQEFRAKSPESLRGKACRPAGLESAVHHQSAAAVPPPQIDVDVTGFRLETRRILGLRLGPSSGCRLHQQSQPRGTVYLDLCLIFLLFRFSLWNIVRVAKLHNPFSLGCMTATCVLYCLTCACASSSTVERNNFTLVACSYYILTNVLHRSEKGTI